MTAPQPNIYTLLECICYWS